jgi:hypothetical protein
LIEPHGGRRRRIPAPQEILPREHLEHTYVPPPPLLLPQESPLSHCTPTPTHASYFCYTTAWNNDLFQKMACEVERKMGDASIAKRNVETWQEMQRKQVYTPDTVYNYGGHSQPPSARSTGSRTAKRISRSQKLKAVISEEMSSDLQELKEQAAKAVSARRRTNNRLKMLVGMVDDMTAEDKLKSTMRFQPAPKPIAGSLHARH